MKSTVFNELRSLVYDHSGIRLQDGKETMVSARIAQRLRALDLTDEAAYLSHLKDDAGRELIELMNVISTNVTHFFRESEHFDYLKGYIEGWLESGQRRFRIWSAASSTGEEPYTLAMTVSECLGSIHDPVDVRILATDISTRVLKLAMQGVFEAKKVEPIPERLVRRYFEKRTTDGKASYEAKQQLKSMLLFKELNLSKPPFPMTGPMDVIFCRNVMIYFDDPVRTALVEEFHRLLRPGGYLIVGKSESLTKAGGLLERAGPSVYRKES